MTDTTSDIRREMAETRDRMARDVEAIKDHVTSPVRTARQRLDVAQLVREHPWPALGAAVLLGSIVGSSGADAKAAAATAAGVKRAAQASKDAASAAVEKLHSSDDHEDVLASEPAAVSDTPGWSTRLFDALGASVAGGIDRLLDELRVAARDFGARNARPLRTAAPARPVVPVMVATTAVVAVREETAGSDASDQVPVPNEMMPSEVDARADAVEALGGGTHEPPLAPGAGDLGARWA
jgi:hypothetical protein